jgi:hypothetical protein
MKRMRHECYFLIREEKDIVLTSVKWKAVAETSTDMVEFNIRTNQ